jgi:hydrogenase expression/formation protein
MSFEEMKKKVDQAAAHAIRKKERMVARIRGQRTGNLKPQKLKSDT